MAHQVVDQLRVALTSRVVVEQAKGRLLESGGLHAVDEGFDAMRRYARSTNQRVTEVATAIMAGTLSAAVILRATR